jgi:hypothetical protein
MATTLAQSLQDIVGWFNAADVGGLRSVMADEFVLKKALHPDSVWGEADTVRPYLRKDMSLPQPSFTPFGCPTNGPGF